MVNSTYLKLQYHEIPARRVACPMAAGRRLPCTPAEASRHMRYLRAATGDLRQSHEYASHRHASGGIDRDLHRRRLPHRRRRRRDHRLPRRRRHERLFLLERRQAGAVDEPRPRGRRAAARRNSPALSASWPAAPACPCRASISPTIRSPTPLPPAATPSTPPSAPPPACCRCSRATRSPASWPMNSAM